MGQRPTVDALEGAYEVPHRIYELCGVTATVLTGTWLAARMVTGAAMPLWWYPLALVLGMLGADLVSGVVHWGFDTWGGLDTPLVGRLAIRAFRQHHLDPRAMLAHDFIETNGHNFTLALSLTVTGLWLAPDATQPSFSSLFLLSMALFVAFTSQIHKWAHMERPPRLARWLQHARLILSPAHHQQHHTAPYLQSYCITVGWLDGLLRATRAFRRIERLVTACTGIAPRRDG